VWALSIEGESKAMPVVGSPAAELQGEHSPDGQFMTFTSNESGRNEVYILKFPDPTTRRKVSTDGGGYPRWSKEGNELYFRSLDGQLVAVPVRFNGAAADLGDPRLVMRLIEPPGVHPYPYDIASDGRILALTPVSGAGTDISLTVLVNWQVALQR
jgi:hypothetical protein